MIFGDGIYIAQVFQRQYPVVLIGYRADRNLVGTKPVRLAAFGIGNAMFGFEEGEKIIQVVGSKGSGGEQPC